MIFTLNVSFESSACTHGAKFQRASCELLTFIKLIKAKPRFSIINLLMPKYYFSKILQNLFDLRVKIYYYNKAFYPFHFLVKTIVKLPWSFF